MFKGNLLRLKNCLQLEWSLFKWKNVCECVYELIMNLVNIFEVVIKIKIGPTNVSGWEVFPKKSIRYGFCVDSLYWFINGQELLL